MPPLSHTADPYRKDTSTASASATARPTPRPGDVVGEKYRIETVIGQGGMGAVFRARHLLTERAVALKWMLPEVGGEEAVQRFLREARAMGRIDHAGVVGVLDVGVDQGATFLVMELLKGNSLRDMLEAHDRFEPAEAIGLLLPALEGVEAAHRNGVVHRDLKPENIFVVRGGDGSIETTKVLDFGISKLRDDRLEHSPQLDKGGVVTRTGVTIGTPSYMSPEQVRGSKDIDARTDVWSLGVILYELLTGHVPFRAESFGALLVAIAVEGYPPLHSVRPGLPAMLVAAVHRALEKEPSVRFADVASLAAALEPFAPKGMRFRVPNIARLTDVDGIAAAEPTPPSVRKAEAETKAMPVGVVPGPTLAGTAVAKPRAGVELRATPNTRLLDAQDAPLAAKNELAPREPSIESRGLDVPEGDRASPHALTALAASGPVNDASRARIPSLPPLDLDASPPRRPARVEAQPSRPMRVTPSAPEPAPMSETTRFLAIGAGIFVVAVLLAIGLRLASGLWRETPAPTPIAITPPPTTPPARLDPPITSSPPPPTSMSGSTTTSGTSLSQPPATVPVTPPTTTTSRPPAHDRSSRGSTPSGTRTTSVTPPPTTPVIVTPPPTTSATTMRTEPTGSTGSLSREEF